MLTSPCSSSSLLCHRPALSSSRSKFRAPCRTVFSPALTQISPITASPSKSAKHVRFLSLFLSLFNYETLNWVRSNSDEILLLELSEMLKNQSFVFSVLNFGATLYFLQKWKILCFRNEDSAPENPEQFVPEEVVKPDQEYPSSDNKDGKTTLQKV